MNEAAVQPDHARSDVVGSERVAAIYAIAESFASLDSEDIDDAERLEIVRALEHVQSGAAAAQAGQTARFVVSQRRVQAAAGVPTARVGRGIAQQVALARRSSPHRAERYVGWAMILTTELPRTYAALQAGRVSEWRALLVARETLFLSREDRLVVDAALAPKLESLGDRRVGAEARKLAYRLDPQGFVERSSNATADRHVSIRPAPDVMARLSALLPAEQGIAAYVALGWEADRLRAEGDPRGRNQLMADLLVQRLTGQAAAEGVPVEICLLMSDDTLLDGIPTPATDTVPATTPEPNDNPKATVQLDAADTSTDPVPAPGSEPALLLGYGPVPAPWARRLIYQRGDGGDAAPVWLRRLFRAPKTGELAAMESHRRLFTPAQRLFIALRDGGVCRTPYCGASIRHSDHIRPSAAGGKTRVGNGQGLCERCNYAREAPGWHAETITTGTGKHEVQITTPTGHHYRSRAPDPPHASRPNRSQYELAGPTTADPSE